METVYRIEHKYKKRVGLVNYGCYCGVTFEGKDAMMSEHANSFTHPNIRIDIMEWSFFTNSDGWGYFCCFNTIEQLYNWFGKWVDVLLEQEFQIVELEVKRSIAGQSNKQAVFHIKDILSKKVYKSLEVYPEMLSLQAAKQKI